MHHHFSRTYQQAREHFIKACCDFKGELASIKHPEQGPDGDIFMDIGCFGDKSAQRVVVISSGTHGVEGYTGSGIQSLLLHEGLYARLPASTRLLMVHCVNPYGFAWQRRTNESNIDLNRNFISFEKAPVNKSYREIADVFEPKSWNADTEISLINEVREFVKNKGLEWYQSALSSGQYEFPCGMFYGGLEPAWSNLTIRQVAMDYLQNTEEIIWIDVHTALGPFGTAECIVDYHPTSKVYRRSVELWGDRVKSMLSGDSHSAPIAGSMISGLQKTYPTIVGAGLEFGTVPGRDVVLALVADQWLHRYGNPASPEAALIKGMMMDAFYPDSDEWRESIVGIARNVVDQALAS